MNGNRIKIPKDPANGSLLDEYLIKCGPLDAAKLHEARLKLDIIYDGFLDPSRIGTPNEKTTDDTTR